MQVQHDEMQEFVRSFGAALDEVRSQTRFYEMAPDIAKETIRRRILGPASPEGLYVDILTVGHDLLGRELGGGEADAIHAGIIESVRVL